MMRRLIFGTVLLFGVVGGGARAQSSADAYFHEAAQAYIDNDLPAARRAVTQGLEVAPSDARLRALREKLRQTRRSEANRSSNADREQSSGEGPESSTEDGRSQSEAGDQSREEPGGQRPESSEEGGNRASSRGEPQDGERRKGRSRRSREGAPRPAERLSRAQAEQLLRALEVQEQQLLRTLSPLEGERTSVEKDW